MEAYCRVLNALLGWRTANNAELYWFCLVFSGMYYVMGGLMEQHIVSGLEKLHWECTKFSKHLVVTVMGRK
jgi:hypothetical protein